MFSHGALAVSASLESVDYCARASVDTEPELACQFQPNINLGKHLTVSYRVDHFSYTQLLLD